MLIMAASYRPNVALLLLNREGRLLVCERVNSKGAWQFPQGGADPGEPLEAALVREVHEEIGLPEGSYKILDVKGGYTYLYPGQVKKQKSYYDGQEQTYYLCKLKKSAPEINLCQQRHPEFSRFKWIKPQKFKLRWLPEFKRQVYRAVLLDFFGARL